MWIINNGLTSQPLVNPVIADLLPASLEFVSWAPTLCNTDAYTLERIDNFNMTGRTLLRITFNGSVPANNTCGGEVQVRVRAGTPPGTVENSLHLIGYANPVIITDRCKAWAVDIYDLDNDGDTSELLCSAVASITVIPTPPALPAAIGDRVWFDRNANGIQDADETGVPGVAVTLRTAAGAVVSTTSTSATGYYHFAALAPGDYFVCFTPPAGYAISPQDRGLDDAVDSDASPASGCTAVTALSPGEDDLTWDLGLYLPAPLPAAIGDRVWFDRNANGIQDADETGVPGVAATLRTAAGAVVSTTSTSAAGYYHFAALAPGDYFVCFTPPAGYAVSPQNQGLDDALDSDASPATGCAAVTALSPGEDDLTWDLGLYLPAPLPAAIGDRVWFDRNANGIQDADETGVTGVTVTLRTAAGAVVSTTTTSATGYYHFTALTPGDYSVCFTPPAGNVVSPQDQGANDAVDSDASPSTGCTVVTSLSPGEDDLTWDMGLYLPPQPAAIGDCVWFDATPTASRTTMTPASTASSSPSAPPLGAVVSTDIHQRQPAAITSPVWHPAITSSASPRPPATPSAHSTKATDDAVDSTPAQPPAAPPPLSSRPAKTT